MKDYKELCIKIKELREKKNISVIALAEKCGMPRNNIYEIERGDRVPSGEKLRMILSELGYDYEIKLKKLY